MTIFAAMQIKKVTAFPLRYQEPNDRLNFRHVTLAKTETDNGLVGWGECISQWPEAALAVKVLIEQGIGRVLLGRDPLENHALVLAMKESCWWYGDTGMANFAISALDIALWDLKARLLNLPLAVLLGDARDAIEVYGSGGFTSYSVQQIQEQFAGWIDQGIKKVKMKVGANPSADVFRVRGAKQAIGGDVELFVDANGAYTRKQALEFAENFAAYDVRWFEEPVSSDDLEGLRMMRDRAPGGMDIAAGEYGYDHWYFRRMLEAQAVDVLQADATRCSATGFLKAAALASAHQIPLSAHTAPSIHAHLCCAAPIACHLEYFHDHVRIEHMLFDQVLEPVNGCLYPDRSRPGLGIELKRSDAVKYAA